MRAMDEAPVTYEAGMNEDVACYEDEHGSCEQRVLSNTGVRVTSFGLVMLAFGLLLWSRLILVTGHPRTATADPAERVQDIGIADHVTVTADDVSRELRAGGKVGGNGIGTLDVLRDR